MRPKRFFRVVVVTAACLAVILAGTWFRVQRRTHVVHAASHSRVYVNGHPLPQSSWTAADPGASVNDPQGGIAQYGYAIQQANNLTADVQAVSMWAAYVGSRSGWNMDAAMVGRLANGDWSARRLGQPAITPTQLANAVSQMINSVLSTMTESQEVAMLQHMTGIDTPRGRMGVSPDNYLWHGNLTLSQNASGAWLVTINANPFIERKAFYQKYAPESVTASSNFYPAEAMLVTMSVATGDRGMNDAHESRVRTVTQKMSGLNLAGQLLYGDNGYHARRPVSIFFTDATLGQLYSSLGF